MPKSTKRRQWRKLTRKDIPNFDDYATKAILFAMEHGAVGAISNKGHAMIKAPDGRIMGVSANSFKARQVTAIRLRELFGESFTDEPKRIVVTRPAPAPEPELPAPALEAEPTLECTVPSCDAVFCTEGARYSHVHGSHHVCPHPGCTFARDHAGHVAAHYRIVHDRDQHPRRVGAQRAAERAEAAGTVEMTGTAAGHAPEAPEPTAAHSGDEPAAAGDRTDPEPVAPDAATSAPTPRVPAPRPPAGDALVRQLLDSSLRVERYLNGRMAALEEENRQLRQRLDDITRAIEGL